MALFLIQPSVTSAACPCLIPGSASIRVVPLPLRLMTEGGKDGVSDRGPEADGEQHPRTVGHHRQHQQVAGHRLRSTAEAASGTRGGEAGQPAVAASGRLDKGGQLAKAVEGRARRERRVVSWGQARAVSNWRGRRLSSGSGGQSVEATSGTRVGKEVYSVRSSSVMSGTWEGEVNR